MKDEPKFDFIVRTPGDYPVWKCCLYPDKYGDYTRMVYHCYECGNVVWDSESEPHLNEPNEKELQCLICGNNLPDRQAEEEQAYADNLAELQARGATNYNYWCL